MPNRILIYPWTSPTLIDLYCERTGPTFWDEPVNAISNIVFIVAAVLAWRQMAKRAHNDIWEKMVITLAGLIGVGSFLFHTYATAWAELTDIIPIWGFVAGYALLTIYRSTHQDAGRTTRLAFAMLCAAFVVIVFTGADVAPNPTAQPRILNGSLQYAPALIVLVVFSSLAQLHGHAARHYFSIATVIFLIALLFRSTDLIACDATDGIGTHFLWHLLNGLMIGILLQALVVKMPPIPNGVVQN